MLEENKVVLAIKELRDNLSYKYGTENKVAGECINGLGDILYYISIGKYDRYDI